MHIEATTVIDRPREEVFAFLADATNDPRWCKNVKSCRHVSGSGLGARYEAVHKPGPAPEATLEIEVTTYEAPSLIGWRQVDEAGVFDVTYRLEELDESTTRVTQIDDARFRGPIRLLSPVLRIVIAKTLKRQFADLKELLEAGASRDAAS